MTEQTHPWLERKPAGLSWREERAWLHAQPDWLRSHAAAMFDLADHLRAERADTSTTIVPRDADNEFEAKLRSVEKRGLSLLARARLAEVPPAEPARLLCEVETCDFERVVVPTADVEETLAVRRAAFDEFGRHRCTGAEREATQ